MSSKWKKCRRLLCIRADNMGDVIMSGPAMRALKQSFHCNITLLTSKAAMAITGSIKEIDKVIAADLPWVKNNTAFSPEMYTDLVEKIAQHHFDGAVIFTVYSQSPLPAAMLAFSAGIPLRLAYCRENPYELLSDWIPDKEPYEFIKHQVLRDLELVSYIGATTADTDLRLNYPATVNIPMQNKLKLKGVDLTKDWIILHPGVSEIKRQYLPGYWTAIADLLYDHFQVQLLISGTQNEKLLASSIAYKTKKATPIVIAGLFDINEFIACIMDSLLVITVNTATAHIAAAVKTPQVVLYAATNPQHTPWNAPAAVLYFPVGAGLQSKNEVIRHVNRQWAHNSISYPSPALVLETAISLLKSQGRANVLSSFG